MTSYWSDNGWYEGRLLDSQNKVIGAPIFGPGSFFISLGFADIDNDVMSDFEDNCSYTANPDQFDLDEAGTGNSLGQ